MDVYVILEFPNNCDMRKLSCGSFSGVYSTKEKAEKEIRKFQKHFPQFTYKIIITKMDYGNEE